MNQLVLHHTYIGGSTFDVSGFSNHGIPEDVTPGTGATAGSYQFDQPTSGILVGPSGSLSNLVAIRARIKFRHEPINQARFNLMEGFLSFAMFIQPDGSLRATIVDANGAWTGATTPAGTVSPNVWHEAELQHDGVSRLRILLDGTVVAANDNVPGPVRSVGNLGVAIGRWPDQHTYQFAGFIGETQLWRFHPEPVINDLLDRCCEGSVGAIGGLLSKLRQRGLDWEDTLEAFRRVQAEAIETAYSVRMHGKDETSELDRVQFDTMLATLRRSRQQMVRSQGLLAALLRRVLGDGYGDVFTRAADRERGFLGLEEAEILDLIRGLCLGYLIPGESPPDEDSRTDMVPDEGGPWNDTTLDVEPGSEDQYRPDEGTDETPNEHGHSERRRGYPQ
jgi:concanavalin A-like lectin/glucanase superfamily protein